MSAVINPVPLGSSASVLSAYPNSIAPFKDFDALPEGLAARQTTVMYIDPNQNVFHLNGPLAGTEGVTLGQQLQGDRHLPFTQVVTESAYQLGATIERTNVDKRIINARVQIGNSGMSNILYRYCEDRWWAGQQASCNPNQTTGTVGPPGWLGVFTRLTGWRWIQVWPYKGIDTPQRMDPVAYGNNYAMYDITWIAPVPYYSKPAAFGTWSAATSGATNSDGYYYGHIALANRGDMESYVQYLVSAPDSHTSSTIVQDNYSSNQVELPELIPSDTLGWVNTDPTARTLAAAADPVDTLFDKIIRSSSLLNFFLAGIAEAGEPWWMRGYTRFMFTVPPGVVTHFKVASTDPNATITAILGQRYSRSW